MVGGGSLLGGGRSRTWRSVGIAVALAAGTSAVAADRCAPIATLQIEQAGAQPLVTAHIDGRPVRFLVDSGAVFSTMTPGTAARLRLALAPAPATVRLQGVAGSEPVSTATVASFEIGGARFADVPFVVAGGEIGAAGLLGQNIVGLGDADYDLAHGIVRLVPAGCLPPEFGGPGASSLQLVGRDARNPRDIAVVALNGVPMRAVFDTGASRTTVSRAAAARAGITTRGPGVSRHDRSRGIGGEPIETWTAPVSSLRVGGEDMRDRTILLGDIAIGNADMLIGADYFLGHRVYVANGEGRIHLLPGGG